MHLGKIFCYEFINNKDEIFITNHINDKPFCAQNTLNTANWALGKPSFFADFQ